MAGSFPDAPQASTSDKELRGVIEATARGAVLAETSGGVCGGNNSGLAFCICCNQGMCTSGRLACGHPLRWPPPKPPLGPEALLPLLGLAAVGDAATRKSDGVEALGRRATDVVVLLRAHLQRIPEHHVLVGGRIPYQDLPSPPSPRYSPPSTSSHPATTSALIASDDRQG